VPPSGSTASTTMPLASTSHTPAYFSRSLRRRIMSMTTNSTKLAVMMLRICQPCMTISPTPNPTSPRPACGG
jgi:hypothetical protein